MALKSLLTLILLTAALASCDRRNTRPAATMPTPPATVIFRSPDGRTLTTDDLKGVTGTFRYEIVGGGDSVPPAARELHDRARAAGSRGDYDNALALLARAAQLAPRWPYPLYDAAFTYLLKKDYDNARLYYRKTLDLSPRGFFTAITALDTLERERRGELPAGLYTAYVSLEWLQGDERARLVRQLTTHHPTFAPGWKALAVDTPDPAAGLAAIERGLAANPDAETRGILLINKALTLHAHTQPEDRAAAIQLLAQLALDPQSTLATEHLAKATLATMLNHQPNPPQ
jgi:tetratricopeptide (TPR) repeat protein